MRIKDAWERLDSVVYRLIRERRNDPTGEGVISTLLDATDEHDNHMSDEQIRDEDVTLLLAGHETTALSLTLTMYALAHTPTWRNGSSPEWTRRSTARRRRWPTFPS